MESVKNKTPIYVGIGIIVVIIICLLIPAEGWSGRISSGRYVSEATIVDKSLSDNTIVVRLYSMTAKQDRMETDTYVALQGNIPSDCYLGQLVRIGYSKEGLYRDTNQSVEVDYMVKGNLLMNVILPGLKLTAHSVADDLKIIGVKSDGTLLGYNVAN